MRELITRVLADDHFLVTLIDLDRFLTDGQLDECDEILAHIDCPTDTLVEQFRVQVLINRKRLGDAATILDAVARRMSEPELFIDAARLALDARPRQLAIALNALADATTLCPKSDSVLQAHDVQSITGRGVKATVDGQPVYIGKDSLFAEIEGPPLPDALRESVEKLKVSGRTTMIVRRGDTYLGVLGLMDTPREAAKNMIARLRELGIRRMIMLSGDNQQVANAVAKEVGIDEALGDLMPDAKVEAIKKLSKQGGVAMVGDGVNDAPAMANATVGIAMGAAGSDVALETADVALMADDLNHLPFAVGLSRQTSRIIRQNLWLSLGMVAFLVPATVLGLRLGPAVLLHEGSTLLVVLNALRLLAYQASRFKIAE